MNAYEVRNRLRNDKTLTPEERAALERELAIHGLREDIASREHAIRNAQPGNPIVPIWQTMLDEARVKLGALIGTETATPAATATPGAAATTAPAVTATPGAAASTTAPKPPRAKNAPGYVAPRQKGEYAADGYFKVPNAVADQLMAYLPLPLLRAYIDAHRLAASDGQFRVSQERVGTRGGLSGDYVIEEGKRIMDRLQHAGLVRLVIRGSKVTKTASVYQLVPPAGIDMGRARESLSRPYRETRKGRNTPGCSTPE